MADVELLPCPFCGNPAHLNTIRTSDREFIRLNGRDTGYGVNCERCGVNNRGFAYGWATVEKAVEHWNTRANMEPLLAEVEHWRHKAAVHQYRRKKLEEALRNIRRAALDGCSAMDCARIAYDALAQEDRNG